jgi:hypothetical protein
MLTNLSNFQAYLSEEVLLILGGWDDLSPLSERHPTLFERADHTDPGELLKIVYNLFLIGLLFCYYIFYCFRKFYVFFHKTSVFYFLAFCSMLLCNTM